MADVVKGRTAGSLLGFSRALVAGIGLCQALGAHAQTAEVGAQFQVNSYTTDGQDRSTVATGPDGDFVVVWQSSGSYGTDASASSIQGQRYDAAGNPIGQEFQVNSYTTGSQNSPAVAARPGGFVVVWDSDGSDYGDTAEESIQGQLLDAAGDLIGQQFQVNSYTTGFQNKPAVAVRPDGGFVVVWVSNGSSESDTSSFSIQGQRYDAAGDPIDQQFQVNSYTTGQQGDPTVAAGPDRFVVVWDSDGSNGTDTSGTSIQGQRFDAAGSPIGKEFQINSYITTNQSQAEVAAAPDGDFVVVWQSYGSNGTDATYYSIQGQRFDAAGDVTGQEFQVNSYTTLNEGDAAVAADPDGDFVVVWRSDGYPGSSIQAQRFDVAGEPIGSQFEVNAHTATSTPAVSTDSDGDFVVVWSSPNSSGTDTSGNSIQGQRFRVTGAVGDRVWRDLDHDGLQDPGEPGIAGATVHLFDPLGGLRRSTTSDANGLYRFQPKPGDYFIQFEPLPELSFTAVNRFDDDTVDSDADIFSGETDTFSVSLVATDHTWDAGMANGLGDRVWLDQDGDGFQDLGEPGIAGVVVSLYDELGGLLETTVTDLGGFYGFQDLAPDQYVIGVAVPPGGAIAPQNAVDDRFDSDIGPVDGRTPLIDVTAAALDTTWDAGLISSPDQLPLVFADGFESGDTSTWSAATP